MCGLAMAVLVGCGAHETEGVAPPPESHARLLFLVDVSSSNARSDPPAPELTRRGAAIAALAEAHAGRRVELGVLGFDDAAHDLSRGFVSLEAAGARARIDAAARAIGAGHRHTRYPVALEAARAWIAAADPAGPAARDEVVLIANGLPHPVDAASFPDALIAEVEALVASSPALRFHTVYFGTGTPAQLNSTSIALLERLARAGGGQAMQILGEEPLDLSTIAALRR